MKRTDNERIKRIYDNASKLNNYISEHGVKREDIISDISLQWLVTTPLYNIGEHVYNLSDDFKKEYDDIPWDMIAGLRHRLVHDYEGTNWNIIVEVIYEELPEFLNKIKQLQKSD